MINKRIKTKVHGRWGGIRNECVCVFEGGVRGVLEDPDGHLHLTDSVCGLTVCVCSLRKEKGINIGRGFGVHVAHL